MLKSLFTGAFLAAVIAGCASMPPNPGSSSAAADAGSKSGCVATGSRVPLDKNECAAFGRSYSGEDLQRTGHIDTARALQSLDPAITSTGH
jgi:hypothetical protein